MPPSFEREATAFYEGLLGLPRVAKPLHLEAGAGCWSESDTTHIHLGVEEDVRPARKAHAALLVSDLDAVRRRLETPGVEIVDDEPLPDFDRFCANDPFGNRLEFRAPFT